MKKYTVYKETSDDWCPSYELSTHFQTDIKSMAQVNFGGLSDGMYRVSVWGADDIGMNIDFKSDFNALSMFLKVLQLDDITMDKLTELGFKQF